MYVSFTKRTQKCLRYSKQSLRTTKVFIYPCSFREIMVWYKQRFNLIHNFPMHDECQTQSAKVLEIGTAMHEKWLSRQFQLYPHNLWVRLPGTWTALLLKTKNEHFEGWLDEATFSRSDCDQTSGHTKYHKLPNESYGYYLSNDAPWVSVG